MTTIFFDTPAALRDWLAEHHTTSLELWVGYYKKGSGTPSITWPESVDEALCYGWIDGLRKSIDENRYHIRFTPRKPRGIWSAVNLNRVAELLAQGRMQPTGIRAYEARRQDAGTVYSYEQPEAPQLDEAEQERFRDNLTAWVFFQTQPLGYQRTATHWVVSAKQPATRARRLETLIDDSARGCRIAQLRRPR